MKNQPQWIAIYHNVNANEIQTFNVLAHSSLRKDIVEATKKCNTKEDFEESLRRSMRYHYWSKCQWEIVISPWCGGKNTKEIKIDVFDQVFNNWEIFLDYVWNERKNICQWEKELNK